MTFGEGTPVNVQTYSDLFSGSSITVPSGQYAVITGTKSNAVRVVGGGANSSLQADQFIVILDDTQSLQVDNSSAINNATALFFLK